MYKAQTIACCTCTIANQIRQPSKEAILYGMGDFSLVLNPPSFYRTVQKSDKKAELEEWSLGMRLENKGH